MSWRIRKSIKVAPGTRINISGSGVSATTRLGKTGISHRTQLVGGRKSGSSTRKKRGCLGSVIGFVLLLGLLGALFGGGDKSETASPSPSPSAALAVVSPAPTPEPTPDPTPTPEPTPGPLDELQAKIDGLQEQLENGEFANMERDYVLNTSTMRYHLPGCSSIREMNPSSRQDFHGTRAAVEAMGYTPCGICYK